MHTKTAVRAGNAAGYGAAPGRRKAARLAGPAPFRRKAGLFALLQLALLQAYGAPLDLATAPLFLTSTAKANVMMMFGNSNSMDAAPSGTAVGSNTPGSKSEIAREAIKAVVGNYTGYINMGLMAYQQNALQLYALHDSQYDASYSAADYNANFKGARNSKTKAQVIDNPTSAGDKIYFNVNLPFYSSSSNGNASCYSSTACTDPSPDRDFRGSALNACARVADAVEVLAAPDTYQCYKKKTGGANTAPDVAGSGYSGFLFQSQLFATDSDLGRGITDFGKQLAWQYVGQAWFNNGSPGGGYIHVPVAGLDATQAAKINSKLATARFTVGESGDTAGVPLQNGGLSPLEGTILTASKYFNKQTIPAAQGGFSNPPVTSCSRNFVVTLTDGLPSVTKAGVARSDKEANLEGFKSEVAAMRTSAAKVETYVVGFALPPDVPASQLDQVAAAGGSLQAYRADDKASLDTAFSRIFKDILEKTAAASSVALSSQSVPTDAHVYQAKFSSVDWSGQLFDYPIGADGKLGSTPLWDAGEKSKTIVPAERVVLTYKPSLGSARKGIAFRWPAAPATPGPGELDAAQIAALNKNSAGTADGAGSLRLDWLRGARGNEGESPKFRKRIHGILGDMVNSAPHYVGVPGANLDGGSYAAFRTANATRAAMIYVGANDGMLHGFDAATGAERLAFVPSGVYPHLSKLTDPGYTHRYYVDGSPVANDVFYGNAWHTVLVGSMGHGARGVFGLNVTSPANFSEASAASLVNFEYTDVHDADVGHISGPVSIIKTNTGRWAALFGNGYNGASGKAALFVVDIENGSLIAKIEAGAAGTASPNALATPLAIDADSNQTVDTVYAGDLQGNMWKFDLSSTNANQWGVAYKLFAASKPITSAPDAGEHPQGGYMVVFGTGKYLEGSDNGSAPGNTMYGIWDKGAAVTGTLLEQTLTDISDIAGVSYRTASRNPVNWAIDQGWKVPFPDAAERVISDPVLRGGRVIFTSIIPSANECSAGGTSWLNEVDWLTGGQLATPPFDTSQDGAVGSADALVQGRKFNTIVSAAAIQLTDDPKKELKFFNESSGSIATVTESASGNSARRLSWRQVQ